MRLNKSLIVKRSAMHFREKKILGEKKKMAAFGQLSGYITYSLMQGTNAILWIAQKKGPSKRLAGSTDPAIIKMFYHEARKKEKNRLLKPWRT